jgi:hypothetical protein
MTKSKKEPWIETENEHGVVEPVADMHFGHPLPHIVPHYKSD